MTKKQWIEFVGVCALWALTMASSWPRTWSADLLIAVAGASSLAVLLYGGRAIWEARSGDRHYFRMASLAVALALFSLIYIAQAMEGSRQLFIWLFAFSLGTLLLVAGFKAWQYRKSGKRSASNSSI